MFYSYASFHKKVISFCSRYSTSVWSFHLCYQSASTCHSTDITDTLIDLAGLDTPSPPQPAAPPSQSLNPVSINPMDSAIPVLPPPPKHLAGSHGSQSSSPSHPPLEKASTALSLLDDELLSLGILSVTYQVKERIQHFGECGMLLELSASKWINFSKCWVSLNVVHITSL